MTKTLKQKLLLGSALVAVAAAPGIAQAATEVETTTATLTSTTAAVTDNPIIRLDGGANTTIDFDLTDNDNTGTANNQMILLNANSVQLTIAANRTITQTTQASSGDLIASAGDRSGLVVTINGAVTDDAVGQDAIDLSSVTTAGNTTTLNINGGASIFGVVKTSGGANSNTAFDTTNGNITVTGAWTAGAGADAITLAGSSSNKVIYTGAMTNVETLSFTADTILELGDDADISSTINNTTGGDGVGTLNITDPTGGGASQITGAVGATNSLKAINITADGEAEFAAAVKADTITISTTGKADFAATVTGDIKFGGNGTVELATGANLTGTADNTSGTAAQGFLDIEGATTVSGQVGATNTLRLIEAGAGAVSFSETVNSADIDFNGANTVNFAKSVTVTNDIDFLANDGTAAFADGAALTGNIKATTATNGTVNFAGSHVVTGSIGVASDEVKAVNFNGVAGKSVSVSGNVLTSGGNVTVGAGAVTVAGNLGITGGTEDLSVGAGSIAVTGTSTVGDDIAFTGDGSATLTGNSTVAGLVSTTGDGTGSLTFAGNLALTGNFGADAAELKALTFSKASGATVTVGGNFEAADTTNVNGNTVAVTGTVDFDSGQALQVDITAATTSGKITSGGAVTVDAGSTVAVDVATSEFVANGQEFTIIDGAAGAGVATLTSGNITDNSFLYSFTQKADTQDLILVTARTSLATASTTSNNSAVGTVLEALGNNGDATLDGIQGTLGAQTSQAGVNDILESVTPTVDGGAVAAGVSSANSSANVVSTRLASLSTGQGTTGMTAGNVAHGLRAWGQLFGQTGEQDARDGIDGYDIDTFGFAVGMDTEALADRLVLGLAFSYADSEVDSENVNQTTTETDTYQITLYGSYDIDNATYIAGQLGYAFGENEQVRNNVGGNAALDARGDYDSDQLIARLELGRAYEAGAITTLTPKVMANYHYYDADGYTETGAAGAGLVVDTDELHVFELGAGVTADWLIQQSNGGYLKPELRLGFRYDLADQEVETTSSFIGGGTAFQTEGWDPAQFTIDAGLGLTYFSTNNWELTANYDFEAKEDYTSHAGFVRAAYKF